MAAIQKIYYGRIDGTSKRAGLEKYKNKIRVAAYCRVSTEQERQQSSLEIQMSVFQQRINEHPGWILAGIYADEGLSGTQAGIRKQFLQMLQDCEEGKIDYIITKSISRFARNTVECLATIRRLQSNGVQIYFEKENIDTATAISEMLLTVLAAFAQEESRSISENLKWGIRKRYESGTTRWVPIFGYRKGENGEWIPQPDEAKIVRLAFEMYEKGKSSAEIAAGFNQIGYLSSKGKKWSDGMIIQLLGNEKYVGDVHMQKFITTNHITHKAVKNDATEIPGYYVRDHHVPIVSRKTYERVQRIRSLRSCNKGSSLQYPYADTDLRCPYCGSQLIQRRMKTSGARMIWTCFGEGGCKNYAVKTWMLDNAVLEAWKNLGKPEVPKRVEYWWLDEYVERIEPKENNNVIVYWKNGEISKGELKIEAWQNNPKRVIRFYRNYMERTDQRREEEGKIEKSI